MSEEISKITKISISEEMKSAYIDYSMSVIVSRALPDVRDGLKPVHRRVLFGMRELGLYSNRPYKKSARIVGEVLGKYHPHGDSSVYFAMVRMAQHWSLRYKLVQGQGNFGSVDGDPPAAMRYTEARLSKITEETLADLDKQTVDFQLNFDDTLNEPTVMPTKLPILLVNGTAGIAVGMATNMPPHNLEEVVNAIVAYIDNENIEIEELIKHIKAPDFPTGGTIYGYEGVKESYLTGKGRVVIRAKSHVETNPSGREKIIITEIPYQVNKAELIQKVGDLVNDKKIEGIAHANDESDRHGMRIVFALKKDAIANVVLNKLYKYTQLQTTFSVNNIALVDGRPRLLNLKQLIEEFVKHRHDVVVRRTKYELDQAEKKAHILEGLLIALDNLDEVIKLIRASRTPDDARTGLIERFELTDIQARAILDMRLQRLTGLEREKVKEEYEELQKQIAYYKEILESRDLQMKIIKDELIELRDKYKDERRTDIVYASEEFNPEDFYADDDVVITISQLGYIKRTPLTDYKTQQRGGTGARGGTTRDSDFIRHLYVANMHSTMLFFTEKGKCYWLKVYQIPEGSRTSKGRAIQNLINIEQDDRLRAYKNVKSFSDQDYLNNHFIVFCTRKGIIKKTSLEEFSRPRQNGIKAINIREGDKLLGAELTSGSHEVIIAVESGKAIRFNENTVRSMGRTASGVKAISLTEDDRVVGMVCIKDEEEDLLVISEKGYGKRSALADYRITNRGGKGIKTFNITPKTGKLVALEGVTSGEDLIIINRSGLTIRLSVDSVRIMGRATQGVRLINLKQGDAIASVAKVAVEDEQTDIELNDESLSEDMNSNEE
jgi:DNA gyrase subunit A